MKQTVLVIDDDTNVARYITFRLSKSGYNVKHIDNGIDGLDEIRTTKPDLVILDMMMPGMDGREVAERINEENLIDLDKIIVLSGKEEADEIQALFNIGIHDYLQKPFNIENLLIRIQRALALNPQSSA